MKFENVTVEIDQARWDVTITITTQTGEIKKFIASADSFFTEHNGIFFCSYEEYNQYWEDNK